MLAQGLVADISGTTLWRWLSRDALCPWRHRTWIFPRDPHFAQKAGPILDLYQGFWEGQPLGPGDFVLSADEKTSIQARRRIHASLPPAPGRPALVEHESNDGVRGPTWQPGTSIASKSSAVAKPAPVSYRSTAWWKT